MRVLRTVFYMCMHNISISHTRVKMRVLPVFRKNTTYTVRVAMGAVCVCVCVCARARDTSMHDEGDNEGRAQKGVRRTQELLVAHLCCYSRLMNDEEGGGRRREEGGGGGRRREWWRRREEEGG